MLYNVVLLNSAFDFIKTFFKVERKGEVIIQ